MLNEKSGKAITSFGKLVLKKKSGDTIIIYNKRIRPTEQQNTSLSCKQVGKSNQGKDKAHRPKNGLTS